MITRRKLFRVGIGTVGTLAAGQVLGQICEVSTGEQPLGPFFPRPNTPVDPIREDTDPRTPIHLANDNDLTFVQGRQGTAEGQVTYIKGKVTDGDCKPIVNASIVIWMASKSGRYNHKGDSENHDFVHPKTGETIQRSMDPYFQYWGRTLSNKNGEYLFKSIVPGFYPADLDGGWYRPPHIHFLISAMGFPQLVTQMYYRGEEIESNAFIQELNSKDHLLQSKAISDLQREKLVVEFKTDKNSEIKDGMVGTFNIELKR